jgi:cobalt-zinc-cadmium efflux system protein
VGFRDVTGHDHHHHRGDHRSASRVLGIALGLTLAFAIVEAVAGVVTGSLALLADAGHMVGDSAALVLSLIVAIVARWPRSRAKTFGYRRAEVLGAAFNAAAMLAVAAWIVVEAIERIGEPPAVRGPVMLAVAVVGLAVNVGVALVLFRTASHDLNVRGALLHVLGDALGSVAAITAGVFVAAFGTRIADPIASIAIALLVFASGAALLRQTTHVLMEGSPEGLDVGALEATIRATAGVASVHDLHVWSLAPGDPILTAHVVLVPGAHGVEVAREVGRRLHDLHGVDHVTIQPEAAAEPESLVELRVVRRG